MLFVISKSYAAKAALVLGSAAILAGSCVQPGNKVNVTLTSAETPEPIAIKASDSAFKDFSHSIPEHKEFECISCHRREGKSRELEFAGHESCVGCHMGQFNEGFNMKFDHAAHDRGEGRPPNGCASCHSPVGPGQSIPSGIDTHNNCYTCHTPDSKVASCSVCHELAPYRRTTMSHYNFRGIFTHGDHRGVGCRDCHNVVAGAPQGRQVTNIAIRQHLTSPGNNCLMCHNGRRAFTGNDPLNIASCSRCHGSSGSSRIPGTDLPEGTSADAVVEPQVTPQ